MRPIPLLEQSRAPDLLPQHRLSVPVDALEVKSVLAQIDPKRTTALPPFILDRPASFRRKSMPSHRGASDAEGEGGWVHSINLRDWAVSPADVAQRPLPGYGASILGRVGRSEAGP